MDRTPATPKAALAIPGTDMPEEDFGGTKRPLRPWEDQLVYWFGALYTAFHFLVLNYWSVDHWIFRSGHIAGGVLLGLMLFRTTRRERRVGVPWWDWALIAASVGVTAYIIFELEGLLFRAGAMYTTGDVLMGLIGTLVVLEFTRRTAGWALPLISLVFILYAFVGPWLPGVLHHRGYSPGFFFSYIYSDLGILGVTTAVSSTYIILFVAFAAFLTVSRVGDYFNDLSVGLCGHLRGGPAKVAVVSGVLFGTISGSSVGNVVASGMITIPMMRRVGYNRDTAAAIEATSSTGGQITPPVMGAGAFIMAEITGIPYGEIVVAAIIPCLLFYVACYAHVDLNALKNGLRGLPRDELPALSSLMRQAFLFAPILVMIGSLLAGYSAFRAGTYGILAAIVASWLNPPGHRVGPSRIVQALSQAAKDTVQLVAVCACAGIVVGVIALTGIGGRFSAMVLALAENSALLAMIFAMLITLVLGMGMPTTAAYAIAAAVVAPGLTRMGVEPLVAHMFIFYYAVLSAITPPVALASFAAASLSHGDPWRTSFMAAKFGLATFIVPFMFFYSPLLLGQGDLLGVLYVAVTAAVGVALLACATEGWLGGPMSLPLRTVLFFAALLLLIPEPWTDLLGFGVGVAIYFYQRWARSRPPSDA